MPKTVTLPDFDLPTRSITGFMIRWILPRTEPAHLYAALDRKELFDLSLPQSDILIGVGHGSPREFTGQNLALLFDTSSIPNVNGKVIILISCETAQELGPALVRAGALSYIGFREDLVWIMDTDMLHRPWADKYAESIMMPIIDCLNYLLDGKTAIESFQKLISSLKDRLADEKDEFMASIIEWNISSATLLGDRTAKIKSRPALPLPMKLLPPPPLIWPIRKVEAG